MPRTRQTISVSSEFSCSASAVWRVLTKEQSYKEWFGYPKTSDLSFIEPGFVIGARLSFRGFSTLVITELKKDRLLSFSNNSYQLSFEITPFNEFIDVTLTMNILSDVNPLKDIEDIHLFLRETLRALKKSIGVVQNYTIEETTLQVKNSKSTIRDFLTRVFAGYQPPVSSDSSLNADAVFSTIIDNTEAAITISKRALLVAAVFIMFFFSSIAVALSFQRSDIVPSSGLSLFESDSVNKYMSTLIRVGDEKQELESKLSCQGERKVYANSSIEFHYQSLGKTEDNSATEYIYVIYDAYGRVRRFAYIDTLQAGKELFHEPSNGKLREGVNYYELNDKNILLSPSMHLYEVEEIIGVPVSAYIVDKNGDSFITTYYFGRFYADDIFNCNYESQIVVTLNDVTGMTSVSYYNPITESNPLPLDELTRTLRRQYADLHEYLIDRFAYEKIFLLDDTTLSQVELMLQSKGIRIHIPVATSQIQEPDEDIVDFQEKDINDNEEEPPENPREVFVYRTENPADSSSSLYRNFYRVEYYNGIVESVSYRNTRLANYSVDTLNHLNSYSFNVGMSYDAAIGVVGILPSAAEYDFNSLTLYFGQGMYIGNGVEYPLKLSFTSGGNRLLKAEFYQPVEKDSIIREEDLAEEKL